MFKLAVFDKTDWIFIKDKNKDITFKSEQEGIKFVEDYPRFGADYSRNIRVGDWQIVKAN